MFLGKSAKFKLVQFDSIQNIHCTFYIVRLGENFKSSIFQNLHSEKRFLFKTHSGIYYFQLLKANYFYLKHIPEYILFPITEG